MAQRFLKASEIGTDGAMTLPGRFYADPEIFRQEQERIFLRQWLCAGRAERIPAPGDFFVRNIGTESVIIVRDSDGAVRAFHNICRHRGARLCAEEQGRFGTGNIRCPYHAWTYALDGRLLGASSMKGLPGFDVSDYPLHPVAVTLWEGFIFLCLADEPEPFERTHAPLIGKFTPYDLPALRAARRIDYDVRANWKLLFENYSECYHCSPIHPALVKLSPADSGENDLTHGPFLGGFMTVNPGSESLSVSGRACAVPVSDRLPEEDRHRVYYYSVFPNMLLSLHPDYVMVHTFWPQSHERTLIECEWLFHADAAQHPGFNPDDGVQFWDQVNREDWHVCELSQLGVASRAYTPGPYSPRESLSAEFDREYLRALGEDEAV
jgi:Phenylpropionate dioxygenase and related ring-hydroxylating dioxygenases, large terminal subunit